MNDALVFDPALIRKYDKAGPRYTSWAEAVPEIQEGPVAVKVLAGKRPTAMMD
jgi:hypothetical protein